MAQSVLSFPSLVLSYINITADIIHHVFMVGAYFLTYVSWCIRFSLLHFDLKCQITDTNKDGGSTASPFSPNGKKKGSSTMLLRSHLLSSAVNQHKKENSTLEQILV